MAKRVEKPKPRTLRDYAESLTVRAFPVLACQRPDPQADGEIELHLAYVGGLGAARSMTFDEMTEQKKKRGAAIFSALIQSHIPAELRGEKPLDEFIEELYRDNTKLLGLWAELPEIAKDIAFRQGVNDMRKFVKCFTEHKVYTGRNAHIQRMVEHSLRSEGLLEAWRAEKTICADGIKPPPPNPGFLALNRPIKEKELVT